MKIFLLVFGIALMLTGAGMLLAGYTSVIWYSDIAAGLALVVVSQRLTQQPRPKA